MKNNNLKPLFKWSGGKRKEIKLFRDHYPEDFKVFVEPFVGAGAVYFDLNFEGQNFIADTHDELICFLKQCRSAETMSKIASFMKNPWQPILKSKPAKARQEDIYDSLPEEFKRQGEATYYFVRDGMKVTNDLSKACRFYYLRKTAYRGMIRYNPKLEFNIPWGKYKNVNFEDMYNEEYSKLLSRTTIRTCSFVETMKKFEKNKDAFIFLDPPYDSEFTDYKTPFGKSDHADLADCFKKSKAKCLMIIGDTPYIRKLYEGYIVEEYDKKYQFRLKDGRIKAGDIDNLHLVIKNY